MRVGPGRLRAAPRGCFSQERAAGAARSRVAAGGEGLVPVAAAEPGRV